MNHHTRAVILGATALLLAAGCGGASASYDYAAESPGSYGGSMPAPEPAYRSVVADEVERGASTGDSGGSDDLLLYAEAENRRRPTEPAEAAEGAAEAPERQVADAPSGGPLLIYQAEVNLAVHEVRERMAEVVAVADDMGGFLATQDNTTVVIRVPVSRFRESLERIETLGDVLQRRISAQDVSDQVRDLRIRLRNAVQMRDRLAELLARADTVPESLTIERELERLTESIELMSGQLRVIQDRVSFSTITVRFQPVRVDEEVPRERFYLPFPWLNELGLQNLMRM
jgi:hypothetical protein